MRNAVKRVTHKERSQPADRKRFGLLEKHKDYVERAKDYKKKQSQLSSLKKKASAKNPDEFYFEMNSSQTRKGVHEKLKNTSTIDSSIIDLMKTQDLGYISMKKSVDDKKISKLKETLHVIGDKQSKIHKIYVDGADQVESFDSASFFQTDSRLAERAFNRPRVDAVDNLMNVGGNVAEDSLIKSLSKKGGSYRELKQRVDRSKKLKEAFLKLSQQRNVSSAKGAKKRVVVRDADGDTPEVAVYRWKRQRK